jgi:hypothetical protein
LRKPKFEAKIEETEYTIPKKFSDFFIIWMKNNRMMLISIVQSKCISARLLMDQRKFWFTILPKQATLQECQTCFPKNPMLKFTFYKAKQKTPTVPSWNLKKVLFLHSDVGSSDMLIVRSPCLRGLAGPVIHFLNEIDF